MITIRELQKDEDLGDLLALSRAFFAEYEAHHEEFFDTDVLRDEHMVQHFQKLLDGEDSTVFLAEMDGELAGYLTITVRDNAPFYKVKRYGAIPGLMVGKRFRRQGIATRLLDAARAFLISRGVKYFTLYTAVANEGALEFYRRNGLAPLHYNMVGTVAGDLAKKREFVQQFCKIEETDCEFDIAFWQRQGPEAIFKAAFELIRQDEILKKGHADDLRMDRSVERLRKIGEDSDDDT